MTDREAQFGTATIATSGTAVAFPYGIDCGAGNTTNPKWYPDSKNGRIDRSDENRIAVYLSGSVVPNDTDKIQVTILDSEDKTSFSEVLTETRMGSYQLGDRIMEIAVPRNHRRYLTASVKSTTTSSATGAAVAKIKLAAVLEEC